MKIKQVSYFRDPQIIHIASYDHEQRKLFIEFVDDYENEHIVEFDADQIRLFHELFGLALTMVEKGEVE